MTSRQKRNQSKNMLHFSIALACEAKGIIHYYGMKPCGGHGRAQFFASEGARLAITGTGALSSAIGTTALGSRYPDKTATWFNLGICGHMNAPIGEAFIANRISSDSSQDRFYPQLPWKSAIKGIDLLTLSEPSTDYKPDQAFDMEGFGFYKAALAFTSTEFLHCIKVVSDNTAQPATAHFDKEAISRMIEAQIPAVETLCAAIERTRPRGIDSDWSRAYAHRAKDRFAFTATETHQLNQRLTQLDALLDENQKADINSLIENPNKKHFLGQLQTTINQFSARNIC